MAKKITIKEQDIEAPLEESRDEIVEHVNTQVPSPPAPASAPPAEPAQQKAECKMRMRELYKCDACGKYLTKKSLNYSHNRSCKGNPENQVTKPKKESPPEEEPQIPQPYVPPPMPQQYVPPPVPLYEQIRLERRRAHLDKINRLSMLIAKYFL